MTWSIRSKSYRTFNASRYITRSDQNQKDRNTKSTPEVLSIQEHRLFSSKDLAHQPNYLINKHKKEDWKSSCPSHLAQEEHPAQAPISVEKRKSFYVTDDISFSFRRPREVAASCSTVMQAKPKHRRKNKQCALMHHPKEVGEHRLYIWTMVSITSSVPYLKEYWWRYMSEIYTKDSLRWNVERG